MSGCSEKGPALGDTAQPKPSVRGPWAADCLSVPSVEVSILEDSDVGVGRDPCPVWHHHSGIIWERGKS